MDRLYRFDSEVEYLQSLQPRTGNQERQITANPNFRVVDFQIQDNSGSEFHWQSDLTMQI